MIDGSLRQAGPTLRVVVQLVDTTDGAHLWAQNYVRAFDPHGLFELQDDLVPRIVSTNADQYGALVHRPRNSGMPAADIDAGYALNGWILYAHPENLAPGMHRGSWCAVCRLAAPEPFVFANAAPPTYHSPDPGAKPPCIKGQIDGPPL